MTHDDIRRLLTQPIEDLDESVRQEMEEHVAGCPACRNEASALQRLHELAVASGTTTTEADLTLARSDLSRTLRRRSRGIPWVDRVREFLGLADGPTLRPALIGLSILAVGFFAGALAFRTDTPGLNEFQLAAYDPYQDNNGGVPQVVNLRILYQDEASGEIEFEFDAVMPAHIRGNMNEPRVQAILARALVSSQNPGIRLRAANVIGSQADEGTLDKRSRDLVKESLISVVLYDMNRGVRMEALKALKPFLPDSAATAAIIKILKREENVAMRIAAINSFDLTKFERQPAREQLLAALRDRSVSDANTYIRIRATAALEEVQP